MNICLDNNSFPFNIKLFAELRKLLDLNWTDPISEKTQTNKTQQRHNKRKTLYSWKPPS